MTKIPDPGQMKKLYQMMIEARSDYEETVELFKKLRFPEFQRKTQYVALSNDQRIFLL